MELLEFFAIWSISLSNMLPFSWVWNEIFFFKAEPQCSCRNWYTLWPSFYTDFPTTTHCPMRRHTPGTFQSWVSVLVKFVPATIKGLRSFLPSAQCSWNVMPYVAEFCAPAVKASFPWSKGVEIGAVYQYHMSFFIIYYLFVVDTISLEVFLLPQWVHLWWSPHCGPDQRTSWNSLPAFWLDLA